MKKIFISLFLSLALSIITINAQTSKITGQVVDQSGAQLRGVNIMIEDTYYGTISNDLGEFRIVANTIALPAKVSFSRQGYRPTTLQVQSTENALRVEMRKVDAAVTANAASQEAQEVSEYRMKLNFVKQFAERVTWQNAEARENMPFVIAVVGYNPFGDDLFAFESLLIKGRKVKIDFISGPREISDQDVVFISKPSKKTLEELKGVLAQKNILTICDHCEPIGAAPTVFAFDMQDGKVRFSANTTIAQSAGITISPELLKFATVK